MNSKKSRVKNTYMMVQNKPIKIKKEQICDDTKISNTMTDTKHNNRVNMITKYVKKLVRSESDMINPDLRHGMDLLTKGAFYYPECICNEKDLNLFKQIVDELEQAGELKIISWSQHCKIENPKCSETFNRIIEKIANIFNVVVCETRLNYYKDQSDWKPLHHDSHAYANEMNLREDFTIGISLGATRELVFMHEHSGNQFKFPQKNGDVFAFDQYVNKDFLHGVTKSLIPTGPRISLIAWCKSN